MLMGGRTHDPSGPVEAIAEWEEQAARRILDARDAAERRRAYAEVYDEDNAVWMARHGERGISGHTARNSSLLASACSGSGPVLDVGGGTGIAGEAFPVSRQYVVCDASGLAAATAHGRPGTRVVGLAMELPFAAGSFDAVLILDVLEHLHSEDIDACLQNARRVLRRHGRLLIATPHRFSGPWDSRRVLPDARRRLGLHLNELSVADMIRLTRRHGFRTVGFETRPARSTLMSGTGVGARARAWELLGRACPPRWRHRWWQLAVLLGEAA